jgi:hypothetical protein
LGMIFLGPSDCGHPGDQLCVAEHRDVRIVGREDEQALFLGLADSWHHTLRDEAIVEIVLGGIGRSRAADNRCLIRLIWVAGTSNQPSRRRQRCGIIAAREVTRLLWPRNASCQAPSLRVTRRRSMTEKKARPAVA